MRLILRMIGSLLPLLLLCLISIPSSSAQQATMEVVSLSSSGVEAVDSEPPIMRPQPAEILKRFIAAEARFRESIGQYTFMRDVVLQTIGAGGQITGEYVRNSQFVFDDRGGRVERVIYHPKSTIREMKITKEDIQDLAGAQLFGFEFADVDRYNMAYVGDEQVGKRRTYAIDLKPVVSPSPLRMRERYFVGRIWIDSQSFQIVKMRGVAVPQGKQRFPTFETLRARALDGEILFPVSTLADEILHFRRSNVHYRIAVRYHAYKRFASKVSILEIGPSASEPK